MIASIPEKTATKVAIVVKHEAGGVKSHVTDALAPLLKVLTPGATETIAQAKARTRLQMEALRCAEAQEKEDAKRAREEKKTEAAKKKEEQAAKKQRQT